MVQYRPSYILEYLRSIQLSRKIGQWQDCGGYRRPEINSYRTAPPWHNVSSAATCTISYKAIHHLASTKSLDMSWLVYWVFPS